MSLKAFHVVFITASILLALGFGGWLVNQHQQTGNGWQLVFGITSFAMALLLAVYEWRFLRKTKHIGYI